MHLRPEFFLFVLLCSGLFGVLSGCPLIGPLPSEGERAAPQEGEDAPSEGEVPGEILTLELRAFDLVNDEREAQGLAPLQMDETQRRVARAHSQDMVARDFFAHDNPDGQTPFDRMRAAGVTYTSAAENIAWNDFPNPADVAVDGWMDSPGHHANIMTSGFGRTGMGVARNTAGAYYFTQVFAD